MEHGRKQKEKKDKLRGKLVKCELRERNCEVQQRRAKNGGNFDSFSLDGSSGEWRVF